MKKNSWIVIGMMSGTSLDGLDLALVYIEKSIQGYTYELLEVSTIPYSASWKKMLKEAFYKSEKDLENLDKEYGMLLGDMVLDFIRNKEIENVDMIASHGHTIFHKPAEGYTLQIGSGQQLFEKTLIPVVFDFRTQDVALGGQGAPLVPIGDRLLFSEFDYCLNLGGFANISYETKQGRVAFDICAVNTVLNHYSKKLGFEFDAGGEMAKKGKVHNPLLEALNELSYYKSPIPKSLGFEFVADVLLPLIDSYGISNLDILRTYMSHIAYQIIRCLDVGIGNRMLVTGGGAFNTFLISEIQKKTKVACMLPPTDLINYKEALIFALLAVLRIQNEVNCLRCVTGAKKDHSSGKIITK